jgi:hypothetical protein
MDSELPKSVKYAFMIGFAGWLIAAFLTKTLGILIFCSAAMYIGIGLCIEVLRFRTYSIFEQLWNLAVAGFFVTFSVFAAVILVKQIARVI